MSEKDLGENNENAAPISPEIKNDQPLEPTSSNDSTLQNQRPTDTITVKKSTYGNLIKGIVAAIAISTFLGGYAIGTLGGGSNSLSADEIKEIISTMESQAAPAPSPQPAQSPQQPSVPQIFQVSLDDDPFKGNPDAPVTVVEFSDFQCPFCKRFFDQTLANLENEYIDTGKVKFVYRDFPLDNIHPNARPVHIAAECADEQGKFWEYHDVLFEKQSVWKSLSSTNLKTTLTQYATDLSLQSSSFEACLDSPDIADEVNADYLEGLRYGATGTPTFFIGNEKDGFIKLVGAQPYATFEAAINSRLG